MLIFRHYNLQLSYFFLRYINTNLSKLEALGIGGFLLFSNIDIYANVVNKMKQSLHSVFFSSLQLCISYNLVTLCLCLMYYLFIYNLRGNTTIEFQIGLKDMRQKV